MCPCGRPTEGCGRTSSATRRWTSCTTSPTVRASPGAAFDLDHYDVPDARIDALVALGAQQVSAHELTRRLIASGLRIKSRDR